MFSIGPQHEILMLPTDANDKVNLATHNEPTIVTGNVQSNPNLLFV